MHEELAEYEEATTDADAVEELADLLELIQTLAKTHGVTVEKLEAVRAKKHQQRGGFEERPLPDRGRRLIPEAKLTTHHLYDSLVEAIDQAEEVYIVAAFAQKSGVALLVQRFVVPCNEEPRFGC